jgi:uncharacterized membrane protein YjgN (DUF898 family)
MGAQNMDDDRAEALSAFRFHGSWTAFLPIALTNLMLTIVTLGVYRFWATTRERQYLWSETEFIDDRLQWTGKGTELFIGFVMVLILILIPFFGIQMLAQALALRGHEGFAALLTFATFGFIFYLTGIARFRGLRYKLSRTYWHGIRGGSDDQGFSYGWSYIWRTFVGAIPLYLLTPWAMMTLWNERWNRMSFGPHNFASIGDERETYKRFLLFYILPIALIILAVVAAVVAGVSGRSGGGGAAAAGGVAILAILGIYGGLGIIAIAFYAKFFRVAVAGLSLGQLDFNFSARSTDWFILLLGDIGLWILAAIAVGIPFAAVAGMIGANTGFQMPTPDADPSQIYFAFLPMILFAFLPLALVGPFIRYRHWKFFITHMQAYGEVNLDDLTQSQTATSRHGEGLLDAFDVGAI